MKRARSSRRQSGFTLVELMVSITIGLILLAGIVQVFLANKQAFKLQQGVSRGQESGRTSMFLLSRTVRQAGYYQLDPNFGGVQKTTLFPAATPRIEGTDGGGSNPDTLVIRFQGHKDGSMLDCLGRPVTCLGNADCEANPFGGVIVTNTFALGATDPVTGSRALTCRRDIPDANPAVADNPAPKLIEGVTSFQVLYGVDTVDDGITVVDQYVTADDVTDWARVLSVQITLVTNSVEKVDAAAATGKLVTQTYSQTITLRNL
jgi:type IV pilus assembly protein PilW